MPVHADTLHLHNAAPAPRRVNDVHTFLMQATLKLFLILLTLRFLIFPTTGCSPYSRTFSSRCSFLGYLPLVKTYH